MKAIFLLLLLPATLFSQIRKVEYYKAACGVEYYVGDTIKLGRGSAPDGRFLYVQLGGWASVLTARSDGKDVGQNNLGKANAGMPVVIKKIVETKRRGSTSVHFVIGGGNITNYLLYVEDAIETGELKVPKRYRPAAAGTQMSIADELMKLKKLKDDSVITEEEYQQQKKQLLN